MKRSIIILFFCSGVLGVSAQQLTTASLYDQQGMLHNPAVAGVQKHGSVGVSYRSMWEGIDGGPKTTILFGSGYISRANLGVGAYLYNDVTGPTRRTGISTNWCPTAGPHPTTSGPSIPNSLRTW